MSADVVFTPAGLGPGDVAGRTVFVIDILRATTTMCAALHHGARAVIPVPSVEEALRLADTLGKDEVLLAGERNAVRIEGFHLGNSPREMTPEAVGGRLLVMTTTNGTRALLAAQGAATVYVAAAANLSAAATRLRESLQRGDDVLVLCAGREGQFALDDAYCAGRLLREATRGRRLDVAMSDAALASLDLVRRYRDDWALPLGLSQGGRDLARLGMGDDLADAGRLDAYPVLAQFHERRVTALRRAA